MYKMYKFKNVRNWFKLLLGTRNLEKKIIKYLNTSLQVYDVRKIKL